VGLESGEIYTLLLESHGDFSDQVMFAGIASGSFLSLAELKISVSEQVAIPAPDSLVLLASALAGWLVLRKKIRLKVYSFIL
jgi:methylase of polypeptide subunit release factors